MENLPSWTSQSLIQTLSSLTDSKIEQSVEKSESEYRTVSIKDISPALACPLCSGYIIDAISLDGCGHAFCRGCILRHAHESKKCPVCEVTMHYTDPTKAMKRDQVLCDLIYLMVPGLMKAEQESRERWREPDELQAIELEKLLSFVMLPKKTSSLKTECILRLPAQGNIGHLKTALCNLINNRRPKEMEIAADDLCILASNLPLENILTMSDIHDYNLALDFQDIEGVDNQRYPVLHYRLISEPNSEESSDSE